METQPWEALHQSVESVRAGWEHFQSGDLSVGGVRPVVLQSWRRSRLAGLTPDRHSGLTAWGERALHSEQAQHSLLMTAANAVIGELKGFLSHTGQVLALCDPLARALLVEGDREACRAAEGIHLVPGSDWSEAASGTNAMGTAAVERRLITIFAAEHYLEGLHPWACVAAPVCHPLSGEVLGILDLSGQYMNVNRHTEMAIAGAVQAIQARLALLEGMAGHARSTAAARSAPQLGGMIGTNPIWQAALSRAARAAQTESTVLITGETGTGKEVLARSIHRASSRAHGPFLAVNCGALPPSLAASELFGYVGGAFTGANPKGSPGKVEAANGGTLFLDEVSELAPEAQVHLLRVLQEREVVRVGSHRPTPVSVRVIAATNKDLGALVAAGAFRPDLFFRLNVVPVTLPPLRDRREDILPLVEHGYRRLGVTPPPLSLASCERLTSHSWPGNVRELLNLVEQAVALGEDPADLLPLRPLQSAPDLHVLGEPGEEGQIRRALDACGGNAAAAARRLGMSRSTLYRKLELYNIRLGRQVQ